MFILTKQTRNSSVENLHIYSISSAADIMEYVRAIKGSPGQINALFERPLGSRLYTEDLFQRSPAGYRKDRIYVD